MQNYSYFYGLIIILKSVYREISTPPPVLFLSSYTGVEFMTVNSNVSDHLSLNITVSGRILDRVRLQIKKAKITRGEKKTLYTISIMVTYKPIWLIHICK